MVLRWKEARLLRRSQERSSNAPSRRRGTRREAEGRRGLAHHRVTAALTARPARRRPDLARHEGGSSFRRSSWVSLAALQWVLDRGRFWTAFSDKHALVESCSSAAGRGACRSAPCTKT